MKSLAEIRKQLYSQEFQLTRHALKRQTERNISITLYEPNQNDWIDFKVRRN